MDLVSALFVFWVIAGLGIVVPYRRQLLALWREPALKRPVLIVESDDWGAGPLAQVPALARLIDILCSCQDEDGRHPVLSIAVILAVPDGAAIAETGRYHRVGLNSARFLPILQELEKGVAKGVFALQLHGLEHYWPETLMQSDDPFVQQWLRAQEPQLTEDLPSPLQSRWIDASRLPSRPLEADAVAQAVAAETVLFEDCFGHPASIAVPTTFIWDDEVETAWAERGIRTVITPGCRNRCRDAGGQPGCTDKRILNGTRGAGVAYLVRNDYFEPEKGHTADQAIAALRHRTAQGRPCLLETHRSNFLGAGAAEAFAELEYLLTQAVTTFPGVRFMSSEELAAAIGDDGDPLVLRSFPRRLQCWIERLDDLPRFRRLWRLIGMLPLLQVVSRLVGAVSPQAETGTGNPSNKARS